MRLTLAPSRTRLVSEKVLRAPLKALFFVALALPTISAQDVTVDIDINEAAFSDNNVEFERICRYGGSSSQFYHLEWLLNGIAFKMGANQTKILQLLIQSITFSHAGQWECRAVFSDGADPIVVNAGTLTVFDPNDITVASQQYALAGKSYNLSCSTVIEDAFISWLRNDMLLPSRMLSSVQLSDEGTYECRVSVMGARIENTVQLNVIVPPQILSYPQFDGQVAFTNERVTLTVTFQSHQNTTTTVRWFKNNIPISSTNITTMYGPAPNATTKLHFEQITREDRGSYRVEIENIAEAIPTDMRTAMSTFDVDVQVPPSRPTGVTVDRINETHVHISWTLTNHTADAGAEVLTLHLQDHPNSPFRLEPNQEEWILYSEPGMMYNLTLKAMNPDGVAATDPMPVKLPATAPSVETFRALRVNDTAFNFTLEVFYTGGGNIEQFGIQLKQSDSDIFDPLTTVTPIQSQTSPRLWYAVVVNPSKFDGLEDPRFNINIVNAMDQSVTQLVSGEEVLPGPPSIHFISKSSDSLTLQIQLSDIGTAPILTVEMNVTVGSQLVDIVERSGNFIQGELIDVTVTGLQPSTEYMFRTRAVNKNGTGAISVEFQFTTDDPPRAPLPPWAIIAIAVGGSVVLTVLCITAILCFVCCCCCKNCCNKDYTEKYCPKDIGTMPEEIKTSAETLNSTSHRGSVRGGLIGNYTSVPLTPRSPTIESCDSPYIKQRFESVTDSDGSRSDIHVHQPYIAYRHYTYSHSPGPVGTVPAPINLHHNDRLSRSLTAFDEQMSPQDITHQATMV